MKLLESKVKWIKQMCLSYEIKCKNSNHKSLKKKVKLDAIKCNLL